MERRPRTLRRRLGIPTRVWPTTQRASWPRATTSRRAGIGISRASRGLPTTRWDTWRVTLRPEHVAW